MIAQRVTVHVKCYSGYRASERPTLFVWEGASYAIERIVRQWQSPGERGFLVHTEGGEQFTLNYNEHRDEWTLQLPEAVGNAQGLALLSAIDNDSSTTLTRKEHNTDA